MGDAPKPETLERQAWWAELEREAGVLQ